MQLWDKILQMALLGSERTHLEPAVEEALRHYRVDPEDPLPQVILTGAATLQQVRKIQILTEAFDDQSLPPPATDEVEHLSLPHRSLLHLKQILSGRFQRALPEFVQLLTDRQWLLPPEFLPELLNTCLQDRELWVVIQPLLGNRARWLIAQHPEWKMLIPQADPAQWPVAGPETRKQIVSYLRHTDPEAAIPLLATAWADFDYRQKLALLDLCEVGLGLKDEDFLEDCLHDSRKEVRQKAADLLAQIPESRLVTRLFQLVVPYFKYTTSPKRLEVDLPKEIPVESQREGIQAAAGKGKDGSMKANWLQACVSRIPAGCWRAHFNWQTAELITVFDTSNRANLLLTALAEASLRFKDEELSTALLRHLGLKNGTVPDGLRWQLLAKQLPARELQDLVKVFLGQQPGLLEEQHLLTRILELGLHPWSEAIARQIIQGLKQWMAESKTFLWNLWHYKRLLEIAGYCCPVELYAEIDADWPMQSPVWNQWAPDVERMLRIMRFRLDMAALPPPA